MGTMMTPAGDVPLVVTKVYTEAGKLCLGADVGDWGDSVLEIQPKEIAQTLTLAFKGKGVVRFVIAAFFSGGSTTRSRS